MPKKVTGSSGNRLKAVTSLFSGTENALSLDCPSTADVGDGNEKLFLRKHRVGEQLCRRRKLDLILVLLP